MPVKTCDLPSAEYLRELFEYDSATGGLYWKARPLSHFVDTRSARVWNTRYAHRIAGCVRPDKYRSVGVDGRLLLVHRVAWAVYHGVAPRSMLDHVNHNPSDNRIENLREVTHAENKQNAPRQINNKSGVPGVWWLKRERRWQATIKVLGVTHSLGLFREFAEAVDARRAAETTFGFHANHGRAAA